MSDLHAVSFPCAAGLHHDFLPRRLCTLMTSFRWSLFKLMKYILSKPYSVQQGCGEGNSLEGKKVPLGQTWFLGRVLGKTEEKHVLRNFGR